MRAARQAGSLKEKHTWDYPSANNSIENIENYDYDPLLPITKKETLISGQNTSFTNFYYPKDILALGQQTTEMQQLINQKRNSEIIKTESFKNTIKQGEKIVKYGTNQDTDGKLQPIASYQSLNVINTAVDTDKIFSIDKYDSKGHILQTTDKSKEPTAIVWGYNQTLPIAKIVGATYGQVSGNISDIVTKSNADIDTTSEQLLKDALDIFRKSYSPTYLVTTYTYDPLIGMTSTTDPSGFKKYYKYDLTNRLEKILDKDNNILEEYKYNYRPTIFYNKEKSQAFTRNNCPANQIGSNYIYTVPADKYTSIISQSDADQQAQNDINTNGQNSANTNGFCFQICTLTSSMVSNSHFYEDTPNHINASFSATLSSALSWFSGVVIGQVSTCRPTQTRSVDVSYNGRPWTIFIYPNGNVVLKLNSGSLPYYEYVQLSFGYYK
ncbi:MAG: hypothetical protein E2600_12115 [Chryseobacterium sp.]|nr:hypothetical protein [Chryseobacterium sp.]